MEGLAQQAARCGGLRCVGAGRHLVGLEEVVRVLEHGAQLVRASGGRVVVIRQGGDALGDVPLAGLRIFVAGQAQVVHVHGQLIAFGVGDQQLPWPHDVYPAAGVGFGDGLGHALVQALGARGAGQGEADAEQRETWKQEGSWAAADGGAGHGGPPAAV